MVKRSSKMVPKTTRRANPSKFACGILGTLFLMLGTGGQGAAPQIRHFGSTNRDATMACIQRLYGKPAVWDRVWTNLLVQPCPATRQQLTEASSKLGIRLLDAQDFIFITPDKLFQPFGGPEAFYPGGPLQAWQTFRWGTIKIHFHLQKWREDQDLPPRASEFAKQILDRARMIPLGVSGGSQEGVAGTGIEDDDLNVAIWQGSLGPGADQSVIALINGLGRTTFSTARLVYGELRDGQYVMLWDSPLFNILHGNVYFKDVNGDGWKEIVIDSTNYGNQEYPMKVVFDHEGRETTRQRKCETTIAADANFGAEDGTCAIFGQDVEFSSTVNPPEEEAKNEPEKMYVTGWYEDGQNHVFELSNGVYVPGPPMPGPFPPPPLPQVPTAADEVKHNENGIKFMQQRNYSAAQLEFERASIITGDKNPLYANNMGFAFYKEQKYDLAVYWLQKTIVLDPTRAVAYLNLGDALAELNRNAEARQAYLKYLELAPDSKAAPDVKKKLDALPPSP